MQDEEPAVAVYVPSAHRMHVACAAETVTKSNVQFTHVVEPRTDCEVPAAHASQVVAAD